MAASLHCGSATHCYMVYLPARYLAIIWTMVVTAQDGIVFWGPIIIHKIMGADCSSGAAPSRACGETRNACSSHRGCFYTVLIHRTLEAFPPMGSCYRDAKVKVCLLSAGSAGAADMGEDIEEAGLSTWATVQASLFSAIPFGFATIGMLVGAPP
jgi:hypothetical protein